MGSKMLIDASQREETRVVVARGSRIEEFDFESASRKPLKGNIYLAKVTRVEPSLQAAFVDYGGNRHGFLAFAEIHPDYYQIPIADRLALIKEQEEEDRELDDDNGHDSRERDAAPAADGQPDEPHHDHDDDHDHEHDHAEASEDHAEATAEHAGEEHHDAEQESAQPLMAEPLPLLMADVPETATEEEAGSETSQGDDATAAEAAPAGDATAENGEIVSIEEDAESRRVESLGAEDALEEVPQRARRQPRRRQYKIQEVIKRRQILLVQVVKEERGNKGAALTTYLSLAGRYCVLMPNTARGGGISRKITDAGDRRRLKEVARDVEVPQGMGLIVRTAGAQRTRPEIKRDFDYLLRLWESVRDLTLQSQAPCLVYEEGSLIKRSIRDLYTKDVDEVIVEGDEAYREAKDFMKMLMPSHAKNVKLYTETKPLFARYQVEQHLDALFSPTVTLPSGGYLVINQTEALVSIDINSGKSTREHSIEDTALKTNLEACDEIGRQLRLRDLAGLVVIDFIDMEENRNNRAVERRIKEALKNDRARIQVGRISHFGLLEMSRQRLRPGLIEGTFRTCPHCEGRGMVRSIPSCGLGVLRQIEDTLQKRVDNLNVTCAREVASYLLNEKRDSLLALEQTYGVTIFVIPGGHDMKGSHAVVERAPDREHAPRRVVAAAPVRIDSGFDADEADAEAVDEAELEDVGEEQPEGAEASSSQNGDGERREGGRRRRRRGRRGGRRGDREGQANGQSADGEGERQAQSASDGDDGDEGSDPAESNPDSADGFEPWTHPDAEAPAAESGSDNAEPAEAGDEDAPARDADGERSERDGERRDGGRRRRDRFGRNRGRGRDRDRDGDKNRERDGQRDVVTADAGDTEAASPAADDAVEASAEGSATDERPRRDRGGRGRDRDRDRDGRRDRDRNRDGDGGRGRERSAPQLVAPPPSAPIIIPDVIPDPEPRKWQPPAPTVQAEVTEKKGGWWSKRK